MRDYALIWNKHTERYEVFDLSDAKRQRKKLGECTEVAMELVTGVVELSTTIKRPTPYAEWSEVELPPVDQRPDWLKPLSSWSEPVDPHDRDTEPLVGMYVPKPK